MQRDTLIIPPLPIFLRPIVRGDLPRIATWHQNRLLFEALVGPYRVVTEDDAVRWMELNWLCNAEEIRMAICRREDGTHIGNTYLIDVDRLYLSASFGIFIASAEHYGRGYGKAAIILMLEKAFEVERLHRIYLDVLAKNNRAIATYHSCGFREEGVSREAALKNGEWVDIIRMAILEQEYVSRNIRRKIMCDTQGTS